MESVVEYLPALEKSKCETMNAMVQTKPNCVSFRVSCVNNLVPKVVLLGGSRTFKSQGLLRCH